MTRHKQHHKPIMRLRSFYLWHRYMGLSVMLLAIMLAITGLALNHTSLLNLDKRGVTIAWLLDWYDIEAPQRLISYRAGTHTISLVEDQLYVNADSIGGHYNSLAGAVHLQNMTVIAADTHLLLLSEEGELIERLTTINHEAQLLLAIGQLDERTLAVRTNRAVYLTDTDLSAWQTVGTTDDRISWATPAKLSMQLRAQLQRDYRSRVLSLERVMLDLHSGRLFGQAGVIIVDMAAILFLLLSGSGLWLWLQQRRKRRQHRRSRH